MQNGRYIDQEGDRLDRLGVVHQCALQRDARVIDAGLVAMKLSVLDQCAQFRQYPDLLMTSKHFEITICV
jgi:hypothetical protein